ncbi:collectin-11 [Plakobranchus ocellatus]|uniref:Collectin-11 n=1 Tax=Plakobranchus ocellatus TaxID=259542 RepID=A0AAV4BVC3_9GAST|nr:collectin-11 [Plakobranchus ocellatus]
MAGSSSKSLTEESRQVFRIVRLRLLGIFLAQREEDDNSTALPKEPQDSVTAMMSIQPISLLLVMLMVSATHGEDKVQVMAIRPPDAFLDRYPLTVRCVFNSAGTDIRTQTNLRLFRTKVGVTPKYSLIASLTPDKKVNVLGSGASVTGEIKQRGQSYLSVKFKSPDDGYCYYYRCQVLGKTSAQQSRTRYRTLLINTKEGRTCKKPEPKPEPSTTTAPFVSGPQSSSCECKGMKELEQKIESNAKNIDKLVAAKYEDSPLKNDFEISDAYMGHIYLMKKRNERTTLKEKNEECQKLGGYLAEFDDQAEQNFVAQFAKPGGRNYVFIGANDVSQEGTFEQYNSKKPMPKLKWRRGEPNNANRREDCVSVTPYGLNDLNCMTYGRNLCEIPF